MADDAVPPIDNVEVMYLPADIYDLPGTVCPPGGPPNGMAYLGPFIPRTTAVQANDAYWFTLHLVSQYPGWIAPADPVSTTSRVVAQPVVPDAGGSPMTSPVKLGDPTSHAGEMMMDWIDRPPPGGASVVGSWTFEQTRGLVNHPDVKFTFDFALENDPRILTVSGTLGDDYDTWDGVSTTNYITGERSYSVSLANGAKSVSVSSSCPAFQVADNRAPTVMPDPKSFTTSDPTSVLIDLIVNVRWIDDHLFVVVTPKDFGDPALIVHNVPGEGGGGNPFGEGGNPFGDGRGAR